MMTNPECLDINLYLIKGGIPRLSFKLTTITKTHNITKYDIYSKWKIFTSGISYEICLTVLILFTFKNLINHARADKVSYKIVYSCAKM